DEGDEIQMPEFEMAAPRDVSGGKHGDAAHKIEQDTKIAAIVAVDENSADKWDQQAGSGRHDYLITYLDCRMGEREDVPAHSGKIHSAAEERNEHGEKEIAEAAFGPDKRPVGADGSSGVRRRHGDTTVYNRQVSDFSAGLRGCSKSVRNGRVTYGE